MPVPDLNYDHPQLIKDTATRILADARNRLVQAGHWERNRYYRAEDLEAVLLLLLRNIEQQSPKKNSSKLAALMISVLAKKPAEQECLESYFQIIDEGRYHVRSQTPHHETTPSSSTYGSSHPQQPDPLNQPESIEDMHSLQRMLQNVLSRLREILFNLSPSRRQFELLNAALSALATKLQITTEVAGIVELSAKADRQTAAALMVREEIQTRDLNIKKTIAQTIKHAGFYTPQLAVKGLPVEYVLLARRRSSSDLEYLRSIRLAEVLKSSGVHLSFFSYLGLPTKIRQVLKYGGEAEETLGLSDLYKRFPDARLILLTDGDELVEPFRYRPYIWTKKFSNWANRALLTSLPENEWDQREHSLHDNIGLQIASTRDGMHTSLYKAFVNTSDDFVPSRLPIAYRAPNFITQSDLSLLSVIAPDIEEQEELIFQLERYLGPDAYDWFALCCLFPRVTPNLTMVLGLRFPNSASSKNGLYSEESLALLSSLPWMRKGVQPIWLRELVFSNLPEYRQKAMLEFVSEIWKAPQLHVVSEDTNSNSELFTTSGDSHLKLSLPILADQGTAEEEVPVDGVTARLINRFSSPGLARVIINLSRDEASKHLRGPNDPEPDIDQPVEVPEENKVTTPENPQENLMRGPNTSEPDIEQQAEAPRKSIQSTPEKWPENPDFFISRAGADKEFALWLGAVLKACGRSYVLQDEHFGHQDFMGAMGKALKSNARIIAVYSPDYFASEHCLLEAQASLVDDPSNDRQQLIPLRLRPCMPYGVLKAIVFTDLVPECDAGDKAVLTVNVVRALGLGDVNYADIPEPSESIFKPRKQILHPKIRQVPNFTGRVKDLEKLQTQLFSYSETGVDVTPVTETALAGMGGVGKSTLAQEYAWRYRAHYQGVWWIGAETRDGLLDGLIGLGAEFIPGLKGETDRKQSVSRTLGFISDGGGAKPYLLVYDNVLVPAALDGMTPRENAHVLITSRWDDWQGRAEKLDLGLFEEAEAVAFLMARAEREDADGAGRLAKVLGYLPLALEQAASFCRSAHMSFVDYIIHYQELLKKKPSSGDYPDSVFGSFSLAIDQVIKTVPVAEKFMGALAFLAPDDIPLDIFTEEFISALEKSEVVAALSENGLIKRVTLVVGSPGISVHKLMQTVMRNRLDHNADEMQIIATALIADTFPLEADDVRKWPRCAELYSHAKSVLEFAPDNGNGADKTSHLCNQLGLYLNARADYAGAEPLMRRALAIDERVHGPDHPNVALRLNNLVELLTATSRLEEAEPLIRRALVIDQRAHGLDHPNVALRLNNLASLLQVTGRLEEAEPLMHRAFEINERSLGRDHPNVATGLNNLASLLRDTDRLEEAEPLMRRAFEINEQSFGPDHPNVAHSLNNLASLLKATDRLEEAEQMAARALKILEVSLPESHPHIAVTLNNLAQIQKELNKKL